MFYMMVWNNAAAYKSRLCEADQHTVGFAMGDSNTGELWVIAVLPGYINKGIGSKMEGKRCNL
jgi:ribosomal protein S18 acetylase RimI-like enzyme